MLRTTIPAVVALVCLGVVGEAQAQTGGSGFGTLGTSGQFIISGERLAGFQFWSTKFQNDPTPMNMNPGTLKDSGTSLNLLWGSDASSESLNTNEGSFGVLVYSIPRFGFDFAVIPNLTVGTAVGYSHRGQSRDTTTGAGVTTTDDNRPSVSGFLLNPRVGYIIGLTPTIALWARGGMTYYYQKVTDTDVNMAGTMTTTTKNSLDGLALSLDPQFVFSPAPHFGVTVGPVLDLPLAGGLKSSEQANNGVTTTTTASLKVTSFGLIAGLVGYF